MHVLIAYDIACNRNRLHAFRILKNLGVNSQRSVFECELSSEEITDLLNKLKKCIVPETDSLLVYPLCRRCASEVQIIGQGIPLVRTDWEVI